MANEFICSDCKGDGTRCDCASKRQPTPYHLRQKTREEMIADNEAEMRSLMRQMFNLRNQ